MRFLKAKMLFLIMFLLSAGAYSQVKTITGTVKDDKGNPLTSATVKAKGAKEGVATTADGSFSITVPASTNTLLVSNTEFVDETVNVKNITNVTVVLKRVTGTLDDVVVIGYQTQKRKDVTGAVSSVKGEVIKSLPVQNLGEALQGRVAGVEVTKSSGEPGASAQLTIRGISSLNQPNALYIIDGVRGSGDNINPQDIATIDILKDASAASIYGAAAAGGVIIITTKKGQGVKPVINFSARYGITTPNVLKLLDRDAFVGLKKLVLDPYYKDNAQTDTFPNTDWVDAVFDNGIEENYSMSVSGAAPSINYFVSGVYNNQKGVYLNNSSEFYSFRINTDVKVSNRVKIGEQVNAWQRQTRPVDYGTPLGNSLSPRLNPPFRTVPTMAIVDANGEWANNPPGFVGPNIVGQIKTKSRTALQLNLQSNVYAEVKLPLSLTFRATLGYTSYHEEGNDFQGILRTAVDAVVKKALYKHFVSYKNLLNAYTLSHDKSYGKSNVNLLVGYEQYQGKYNAIFSSETDVGGTSYAYIQTSGSNVRIAPGGYDPYPLVKSQFGRANYNYDNRFFGSFSIRRDKDFIKFGPENRSGVFPSASAGWKISQEKFFAKLLPKVSLLKLRGSYGTLGNSEIGAYNFFSGYYVANAQNFTPGGDALVNYSLNDLPNSDIKWETTKEANIGLDGELFDGKIFFSLDWYNKSTEDMLYNLPLSLSSGFSRVVINIGTATSKGFDILLGYRGKIKQKVNYSATFTGSFNKNIVENLDGTNSIPIIDGNNNYGDRYATQGVWVGQSLTYTLAGLPFGQFYGYKALGIFKTDEEAAASNQPSARAGDLEFADMNGDKVINDLDRTVIGNPYPKFTYGLSLNFNWKGFDLAMLFNGVAGMDIYNGVAPYATGLWSDGNTTSKVFGASFLGDNGLTDQPRIGRYTNNGGSFSPDPNGNYSKANSYFVEDGSYVKLKNLQIGYNFSSKLLDKAKIKSARVFIMGNNLFWITKYSGIDPELGSQDKNNAGVTNRGIDAPYKYPSTKIYSFGIDLTF